MKRRNTISWWLETRNKTDLVSSPEGRVASEEATSYLIDKLVPLSGSPSSSLATPEDEGDWTPRQVSEHIPGGPDAEVVVHNDGAPDSDAGAPVDIILVDESYSAPHPP